jgi:hypothetical protein
MENQSSHHLAATAALPAVTALARWPVNVSKVTALDDRGARLARVKQTRE